MFGPKRDEVPGEWGKLHNEELNVLYFSPSIVRVLKSRKNEMVRACSVYWEGRGVYRVLVGERGHWGDPGVDGKIILRRIFKKWDVGLRTVSSWLRIGRGGGHL
jgi:hypothetical protein